MLDLDSSVNFSNSIKTIRSPRPGAHFVTFLVIRSRENFEKVRKFYAIEKIEMKLWAKETHLFFSCIR